MTNQTKRQLTLEDCRQYISEKVFSLSPKEYKNKYPKWPGSVGLEVEMFPIKTDSKREDNKAELVELQGGKNSLAGIIRKLAGEKNWELIEEVDAESNKLLTLVKLEHEDNLSFEPGGQLEFSSKPYPCLGDAIKRLNEIQQLLLERFAENNITLVQTGCNPWYLAHEAKLQMTKNRYRAMDLYFDQIGPWGKRMMRLTCTIQVCLDFGDNETMMAKRFLASQLLAPYGAAIFANSPFTGNELAPHKGYRVKVWQHLDRSRTGFPPHLRKVYQELNKESCIDSYLEFLLDSNVVFVQSLNYQVPKNPISFRSWLENGIEQVYPTEKDLATQLSLLFPEVRARNFLELRSLDCQSSFWQAVPAAFYTGLLYDDKNLDAVIALLQEEIEDLRNILPLAVDGLQHDQIFKNASKLMLLAIDGFSRLPSCFLAEGIVSKFKKFNEHFTQQRRVPADDLRDYYLQNQLKFVDYKLYQNVEESWKKLLNN